MFQLTENEQQAIRATLQTQGWQLIEAMIRNEAVDVRMAKHINRERNHQDIAIEAIAKGNAAERMERVLNRINAIKAPQEAKPLIRGIA